MPLLFKASSSSLPSFLTAPNSRIALFFVTTRHGIGRFAQGMGGKGAEEARRGRGARHARKNRQAGPADHAPPQVACQAPFGILVIARPSFRKISIYYFPFWCNFQQKGSS